MIRTASTRLNRLVAQVCGGEFDPKVLADHKGSTVSNGTLCSRNFTKNPETPPTLIS